MPSLTIRADREAETDRYTVRTRLDALLAQAGLAGDDGWREWCAKVACGVALGSVAVGHVAHFASRSGAGAESHGPELDRETRVLSDSLTATLDAFGVRPVKQEAS